MENKKEIKYLTFDEITSVDCDVCEQETCVSWYRGDNTIRWFTSDNTMITDFKHRVKGAPDVYKMYVASYNSNGKPAGYFIEMPLSLLSFRNKHRESTEAQRAHASKVLKELHAKRREKSKEE